MEHIVCETTKANISNWLITKVFIEQWFKKPSLVNKSTNRPQVLKTTGHTTADIITVIRTAVISQQYVLIFGKGYLLKGCIRRKRTPKRYEE